MPTNSKTGLITTIRRQFNGSRSSGRFTAIRCPAHDDTRASASVWLDRTGELRAKCFAGCSEQAVLAGIERQLGMPLMSSPGSAASQGPGEGDTLETDIDEARRAAEKSAHVDAIWSQGTPVTPGDPVGRYLLGTRGLAPLVIPTTIRYRALLYHPWSRTDCSAMVALVQGHNGEVVGVHRTWLDQQTATKALLNPTRAALGPIKGGAIRLHDVPGSADLLVAEGIETTLAAAQLSGWRYPAWATLSASGMKVLEVPRRAKRVSIMADHDSNNAGEDAARILRHRLRKRGIRVAIHLPPTPGWDWNDVLLAKLGRAV